MKHTTRTRTAYHEAGHAVMSAAVDSTPRRVSIRPDGRTLGRSSIRTHEHPTALARVFLAGFAAEHLLTGRRPSQLDRELGMALLARSDPDLAAGFDGVTSSDGYGAVEQVLRSGVREDDEEIRREIDRVYEATRESLSGLWRTVSALARALLVREEIDGAKLAALVEAGR